MKIKGNQVIAKLETVANNPSKDEITVYFTIDAKNPELLKTFVRFHKDGHIITDRRGKKYQAELNAEMKKAILL